MLMSVWYRDWTFVADPEHTRAGYAAQAAPDFASCCPSCENFGLALARGLVFPAEVASLLDQLGIDVRKVAEQTEFDEVRPGQHLYSGWYHFVGTLENGPDAHVPVGEDAWNVLLEPVSGDLSVGFTRRVARSRRPYSCPSGQQAP
jgi:hypothetical protein